MNSRDLRRAEQTLRALADAYDRPSQVVAQFERECFHPELWERLEQIDRKKHELARSARRLATTGASERDLVAILADAERCEREENRLFVRAYWEDMGAGG